LIIIRGTPQLLAAGEVPPEQQPPPQQQQQQQQYQQACLAVVAYYPHPGDPYHPAVVNNFIPYKKNSARE
jgi:hypothetical protein